MDRDGDGLADVVVGFGANVPSKVRTFDGATLVQLGGDIAPFDPGFPGGVFVG